MMLKRTLSICTLLGIGSVGYAAPVLANHEPSARQSVIDGACESPVRQVALQDALEYARSHQAVPWSDRAANASGEVIVQRTYEQSGQFCRDYIDRCLAGRTEYVTNAKACRAGYENWRTVEVFFTDANDAFMSMPTKRQESAAVPSRDYRRPPPAPAPLPSRPDLDFDVAEVQRSLVLLGYDPGPVDGVMGPRTVAAIDAFARVHGLHGTWRTNPDLPAAIIREARSADVAAAPSPLIGYGDPYRYKKRGEGFHAPIGYVDRAVEPGVYLVSFYGGGGGWEGPSEARTIENMLTRALEICTAQGSDGYELLQAPSGELITTGTWRTAAGSELPLASAYVSCCDGYDDGFCTTAVAGAAPDGRDETQHGDTPSTEPRPWRTPPDPYPIAGR